MNYRYSVNKGVVKVKTNTKKYLAGVLAGASLAGAVAAPVLAAKPASPGCFGADRAAYANVNGSLGHDVGGVGYYASQRAGDNGTINQEYKTGCGGDPA